VHPLRRVAVRALSGALVATAALALTSAPSTAEPSPTSPAASPSPASTVVTAPASAAQVAAARAKASELLAQVSNRQQAVDAARAQVAELTSVLQTAREAQAQAEADEAAALAEHTAQAARAQAAQQLVGERRDDLARWASQTYMNGTSAGVPSLMSLLETDSTDDLVRTLHNQALAGQLDSATVDAVEAAYAVEADATARAEAAAQAASAARTAAQTAAQQADAALKDGSAQVLVLSTLLTETQTQASQASAAADAAAAALAAQNARSTPGSRQPTYQPPPASGIAATVMVNAAALLGIPYRWGGSSPAGFDCSGFTGYVFAQSGYPLPRTAAQQQAFATPVSNPMPGDLVFFGSPAHHVGIYAGGGLMYDSPHSGTVTTLRPVYGGATYGRVLPTG
jgi:cell wall-associated NlpC family hydrolase